MDASTFERAAARLVTVSALAALLVDLGAPLAAISPWREALFPHADGSTLAVIWIAGLLPALVCFTAAFALPPRRRGLAIIVGLLLMGLSIVPPFLLFALGLAPFPAAF